MVSLRDALTLSGGGVVSLVGAGGKTSLMFRLARELSGPEASVLTTTTTKIFIPTNDQSKHVILSVSPADIIQKAKQLLKIDRHISAAKNKIESQNKLEGYLPQIIDELWKSGIFQWIIVEADGAQRKPLKAPGPYEPVIPECSHIVVCLVGLSAIDKPLNANWVFRHKIFAEITKLNVGRPIDEFSIAMSILHEQGLMKGSPKGAARIVFLNQADLPGRAENGLNILEILIKHGRDRLKRIVIGSVLYEPPVFEYIDIT